MLFAPGAQAATFNVTSLADDGSPGTLRTAIRSANLTPGADTVTFASGLSGTIQLNATDGAIEINSDSLDIQGPGASQLTVRGSGNERLFTLYHFDDPDQKVTFAGLTLTGGNQDGSGSDPSSSGGAISSDDDAAGFAAGTVEIDSSILTGNHADADGGAFYTYYSQLVIRDSQITNNSAGQDGGGVLLYGANQTLNGDDALTVVNSRITGNTAGGAGGGINDDEPYGNVVLQGATIANNTSYDGGGGAKLYSDDSTGGGNATDITIQGSTFSGNTAGTATHDSYGGGLSLYGHDETNRVTVSGSTFADNTASAGGGGVMAWGTGAPVTIENSTFTGNSAGDQTSAYDGGGAISSYNTEDLPRTVRNSTIVGNTSAAEGGGISRNNDDNSSYPGPDVFRLSSTIVSGNHAGTTGPDLADQDGTTPSGSFDVGFSIIGSTAGATVTENPAGSNQIGVDPQLGPLADNGGPTQTFLPALTSPAVDAGIANGLTTDQRGLARTADISAVPNRAGSDGTDIGSTEIQSASCQGAFVPSKTGTDGDDTITGTDGPDALFGANGNDQINALGANDCVSGDAGNDTLTGDDAKDLLLGGDGNDGIKGGAGKDKIKGEDGKDKLNGDAGKDKVVGGAGKDKIKGGNGKDKIKGNGGKDKINSIDGKVDKVNCGGSKDKAKVDSIDKVGKNCEVVHVKQRK